MATIWSTRLFAVSVPADNAWHNVLTVPMGYRNVIKFVGTTQATAAGALIALALSSTGIELYRAVPDANNRSSNPVTITLHEGESLLCRAYTNAASVSASGYLLQGAGAPNIPGSLPVLPS